MWSSWRVVLGFGLVSLAADMVYEGARSMYGPMLLSLGAGTAMVGLVTGAGEAMALVLRLVAGPMADRRGGHWPFTIGGYATTAICVPLLALSPRLGSLGLGFAAVMILMERAGKALRSPSKSTLLAQAARKVGRGRGFGVHKALDQLGAFAGPLLVAAITGAAGTVWPAMAVLVVPGAIAIALLLVIRANAPELGAAQPDLTVRPWGQDLLGAGLPKQFLRYAIGCALTTGGLVTFGLISVRLVRDLGVGLASVPLIYAAAMLVEAVAALATGWWYDRAGARVLRVVPLLVAVVPIFAFRGGLLSCLFAVAIWGVAMGVQDSTLKALVAELVPAPRLATGYGVFAAIQGALAIVGGAVIGLLMDHSVPILIAVVIAAQALALLIVWRSTAR